MAWEIDGETYTQIGDFFLSHIFFREPVGANACTPLQAVSSETLLLGCVSFARLSILCTVSKIDCLVITWSLSGYTPVGPECPDALSSPCLLSPTWQLVKAHRVTRNERKIHVMLYNIYILVCLSVCLSRFLFVSLYLFVSVSLFPSLSLSLSLSFSLFLSIYLYFYISFFINVCIYLPNPPHEVDETQGQWFKWSFYRFEVSFPWLVAISRLKSAVCPTIYS